MQIISVELNDGTVTQKNVLTVDEYINSGHISFIKELVITQRTRKGVVYWYNVINSFDIETSHEKWERNADGDIINKDYKSFMYHWQMTVNGILIFGRYWTEWLKLLKYLKNELDLSENKRIVIYVHNLPYEWSFIHLRLPIKNVFAREARKPIKFECNGEYDGIIFRCSYAMTNYSLDALAKNTPSCPVKKLKGALDYDTIYTPKSEIPIEALKYCANDVLVLHYCLSFYLDNKIGCKTIADIPLTSTGFVRKAARKYFGRNKEVKDLFTRTRLSAEEYVIYNQAFRGGDTSAHFHYIRKTVDKCYSRDLTSSYPSQMLLEKFPASKPILIKKVGVDDYNYIKMCKYLYVATIAISNVKIKNLLNNFAYIPFSKCITCSANSIIENGRVITSENLVFCGTSLDWEIIEENYDFNIIAIPNIIYHLKSDYLPKKFREFIANEYAKKTLYKNDDNNLIEYLHSKQNINSLYGMTVTSLVRDEIIYNQINDEWETAKTKLTFDNLDNIQKQLNEYYGKITSFLPYEIGVWVTSYGRYDLHKALKKIKSFAIYWDTDSVKYEGDFSQVFEDINKSKINKLKNSSIDFNKLSPKNSKGIEYPISLWDTENDGNSYAFKTWGAKKYLCDYGDKIEVTISGLNKLTGSAFLTEKYNEVIKDTDIGIIFPENYSGRTYAQYSENGFEIEINGELIKELSYVTIVPTTYTLGITTELENFVNRLINSIKERYE